MRTYILVFLTLLNTLSFAQSKGYSTSAIESDLKYFTDQSGMELNKEIKAKNLKRFKSPLMREVATGLLNGS